MAGRLLSLRVHDSSYDGTGLSNRKVGLLLMPYTHKRPLVLCGTYIDTYMAKTMQLLRHEELRFVPFARIIHFRVKVVKVRRLQAIVEDKLDGSR